MSSNTANDAVFRCPHINHINASSYCNLRCSQLKISVKKDMLLFWISKGTFCIQSHRIHCKKQLVKAYHILVKLRRKTFISFCTFISRVKHRWWLAQQHNEAMWHRWWIIVPLSVELWTILGCCFINFARTPFLRKCCTSFHIRKRDHALDHIRYKRQQVIFSVVFWLFFPT